ncbi:hypothetical protein SAMN04488100_10778 [Alkalibacterium putridalgicola]|uniref:Uncharacterized protein n=2 Tax=Alkalibacterium putridalgicola TaxID=426703 RepID=A0A1H7SBG6_9LACT|nr:hypothetical protein SAMN04488100_10778 [Alkalibacterium putridalgicola]
MTFDKARDEMKKSEEENFEDFVYGDSYFFIAGYTSGGAPYGITMEEAREQGLLEENKLSSDEDDEDLELPF